MPFAYPIRLNFIKGPCCFAARTNSLDKIKGWPVLAGMLTQTEKEKTMSNKTKKPEVTIRDGSVAVAIWKNDSEKGPFYSLTFSRTYTTEVDGKEVTESSNSFSGTDILKVQFLTGRAYAKIMELRAADAVRAKMSA